VIFANVLLGVNQGLTWSTTVIMKIDLAGPAKRGMAMGFNEAAGYGAVAVTALATGFIAAHYGLRPEPFYLGLAYAGLGLAGVVVMGRSAHGASRCADLGAARARPYMPTIDTSTEEGWLSKDEAAWRLGGAPRTLSRHIDSGQLASYRAGGVICIRVDALDDYIDASRVQPGSLRHLHDFPEPSDRPDTSIGD
jgi:excisionase family DNA binding protein